MSEAIFITVHCLCGAFDRVGRLLNEERYDLPQDVRVAPFIESVTTMATEWAAHAATNCHATCKHCNGADSFVATFSATTERVTT